MRVPLRNDRLLRDDRAYIVVPASNTVLTIRNTGAAPCFGSTPEEIYGQFGLEPYDGSEYVQVIFRVGHQESSSAGSSTSPLLVPEGKFSYTVDIAGFPVEQTWYHAIGIYCCGQREPARLYFGPQGTFSRVQVTTTSFLQLPADLLYYALSGFQMYGYFKPRGMMDLYLHVDVEDKVSVARSHLCAVQLHLSAPRHPRFSSLLSKVFCLGIATQAEDDVATATEQATICLACGYLTTGDLTILCRAAQEHPGRLAEMAALAYPGLFPLKAIYEPFHVAVQRLLIDMPDASASDALHNLKEKLLWLAARAAYEGMKKQRKEPHIPLMDLRGTATTAMDARLRGGDQVQRRCHARSCGLVCGAIASGSLSIERKRTRVGKLMRAFVTVSSKLVLHASLATATKGTSLFFMLKPAGDVLITPKIVDVLFPLRDGVKKIEDDIKTQRSNMRCEAANKTDGEAAWVESYWNGFEDGCAIGMRTPDDWRSRNAAAVQERLQIQLR